MDMRKQKAEQIVKAGHIRKLQNSWLVLSQSKSDYYNVKVRNGKFLCSCPDYQTRQQPCKHVYAVQMSTLKNVDGKERKILEVKRVSYKQNNVAYDKAQTNEKELFMKLLSELCKEIEDPLYSFGRPKLSLKDMVFVSALKVYTTFSLRRFMSDLRSAFEKGEISKPCSYRSVGGYMQDQALTPILHNLILLSSFPLKSVETRFAIDSTGLRTTKFNDYCREKYGARKEHDWIKLHICTGVKTNIITAVEVSIDGAKYADSPQFISLAKKTYEGGFKIGEMSADKAYLSRDNLAYIDEIGGVPYIPFKTSTTFDVVHKHGAWKKMLTYFIYNREEFLEHYHARSNVESTFNMIKSKFTDIIRSKSDTARINEALLKVLCHNIVVLIHEMYELGIEPSFISK